jgi:transmembrane sensor
VDIAFSSTQRLVQLREGALIAQVSRLPGVLRPFTVQSAQGTAQALGTRFMVRQQSGSTLVQVLEHSVRITTASGQQRSLQQGESAQFTDTQITLLERGSAPAAWADGLIDVRNQPLGEVIDALRPYQPGLLRISPEAAQLRIFGVFALEHPRQVLQDLVDTHPIRVRHWGQWLTLIDLAPPRT